MPSIPPVVDAASEQRAPAASLWRPVRTMVRLVLALLLIVCSLALIAWLTLHWGILPRIEQWRPQIEARASRALGVPVRIGGIEVSSSGWVPAFELRDVTLLDARQRPALRLPRVAASVSPRSLLSLKLRFEQLHVEGAQLEVRRDVNGRVFVAGLELGGSESVDPGPMRDWFFEQPEFVIRNGSLRWTDEQRDAPPLMLEGVQLVVRNGLLQHEVRLDATPPAGWGERFSLRGRFRQPLLAPSGDWKRWSGSVYADLPRVDVSQLRAHVTLPFELSEGDGALRAWIEVTDGEPRSATADLALRAVALRLAEDVEPLVVEQVEGRLVAAHDAEGGRIALQRLSFETGDGVRWPAGDLALGWKQRAGQPFTGGEFSAQRLDLDVMAQIASRVPLGEALRGLLAELRPRGIASEIAASWQGPLDAPTRYQAKARFSGLTLAAAPADEPEAIGRPGLSNATLSVSASESGGTAQLGIAGGALELPGVFEEPLLPFDTLAAQLVWKIEPPRTAAAGGPRVTLQVKDGKFANADARGDLRGTWSTGAGSGHGRGGRYPGLVEFDARIAEGAANRVARYLPLGIPEEPRAYVERAVRSGTVRDVGFRVKGDLWDFPFAGAKTPQQGEFRIAGKVEDVTFAYVPSEPARGDQPARASPWPAFTRLAGELVIDRNSLEIRNAQAQLGSVTLQPVQGTIRNLSDKSVLAIDGVARGPLAEMLRFVNATPVREWTGQALAKASASGNAELKLGLSIPLDAVASTSVKGSLALAGNDLRFAPDMPQLVATRGRVEFTHKGFAVNGASARLLGGELAFDGGLLADGTIRFNGQGTASADGLRRAAELGTLARFGSVLSGQTGYRASLGFVRGQTEFSVTSNLVGLAIDLPAPLRKAADAPLPLRFQTALLADSLPPGQLPRDLLRLDLGTLLQVQYQRELPDGAPARVLRGGIGVFDAAPQPTSGVLANVNLGSLRTDAWEFALEKLFPGGAAALGAPSGYLPTHVALRIQELASGARRFNKVVAGVSLEEGAWRANVEAEQLSGFVEYRPPRAAQAAGRVWARLARLSLPKSDADDVETLLDQQAPATVPALDIAIDDFELRGKRLGRLEIEAANRVTGEGKDALREWRLTRFSLNMPEAQLTGSGNWAELGGAFATVPGAAATARRRAVIDFKLDVANGGGLLERLGGGKTVRGGKGQFSGQLSWLGSPLSLDYGSLAGNVAVAIEAGQFLKVEPGAARLLSVLSLQSLPRRLALDFRDVFQEGFPFDSVTGDIRIARGVAATNNLRMRGLQAAVLMEGSADLARETQDLRVIVVPEINAGTASLAYAAINPALGLGTFLAQALLRKPLIQAGTREFHITGSWADPKVERVERKPDAPIPDLDVPAAPASAPRNTP